MPNKSFGNDYDHNATLRFFKKWRKLLLWVFAIALVASIVVSMLITPRFKATATLFPTSSNRLSKAIMDNELWKNQIEQVNVLDDQGIELIPRVGEHIIYIGHLPKDTQKGDTGKKIGEYVMKKLDTLEKFYHYGLSQAGWNKYKYINLEFDNQIICKRRGNVKY